MYANHWSRLSPGIVVAALLCLGIAPRPAPGPAPPPRLGVPCVDDAIAVTGDSTIAISHSGATGVEQAFPAGLSVAACSLRTENFASARIELREWDPTLQAPDPDAIALRRVVFSGFIFDEHGLMFEGSHVPRVTFVPPVVVGSVPGVAEPPRANTAVRLFAGADLEAFFTPEGPAELPAAAAVDSGGVRTPLPGPHAVLAHTVCTGDADLAALRVAQSVSRTDVEPFPAPREFAQRFRVPEQVELRWVELAMAGATTPYFDPNAFGFPVIAILDAAEMSAPVPDMPAPLVEALVDLQGFAGSQGFGPVWISHLDFERGGTVTLEPDHDYWIWVREAHTSVFLNRRIHGDEPPDFTAGVGPYFARGDSAGEWIQAVDQVLAFRIVGKPTSSSPPPGSRSSFALSTTPNPARGSVRVDWSGAVGQVRFDVLDARGRRVAEGLGPAAGTWTWSGTDRNGRAVASGVYFLRARDSAGRSSHQRVMIVR